MTLCMCAEEGPSEVDTYISKMASEPPTYTAPSERWQPPPPTIPRTCGEATLARAALVASGKGDKHPDVVAVDGMLATCTNAHPSAEECDAVEREGAYLVARGYGPRHPSIIANDAKRAVCTSPNP